MMTRRAGLIAAVLSLTVGLGAWAQTKDSSKKSQTQTIHGIISGVTVEGEMVVDYKTNRAATAEATVLTIVGSEHGAGTSDARTKSEGNMPRHRRRHNIYIISVSPKTKVYAAKADKTTDAKTLDALEVGDHVEATFQTRTDLVAPHRKHGRHRTFFGDAVSVTIQPEQAHQSDYAPSGEKKSGT